MRIITKLIFFLALSFLILISACLEDVSRDNPFDPENGNTVLQINGQVLTFYHPRDAIAQATIRIESLDLVAISDADGFFRFENLPTGNYTLICNAPGYHTDSATVNGDNNFQHTFLLDGLPKFDQISIKSHHRSRWFPREEIYYLEIEALVSDPDGPGDINSVICQITSLNFNDTLQADIESGRFSSTLFDSHLPVESVHQLVGRQFHFIVIDDFNMQTISEAKFITRIIEQTPVLLSPIDLQAIENLPIDFNWERVSVPYPATLRIEIFQISIGLAFMIDEIDNIPIGNQSYTYTNNLLPGDYFWTLNIVDEFGNSSSSREGTFQIH